MDNNAFAVLQALFHVILAAVLHARRAPTSITGRRTPKRPNNENPIRPRVQISKPLKP
jgi:hypothetical protein